MAENRAKLAGPKTLISLKRPRLAAEESGSDMMSAYSSFVSVAIKLESDPR